MMNLAGRYRTRCRDN